MKKTCFVLFVVLFLLIPSGAASYLNTSIYGSQATMALRFSPAIVNQSPTKEWTVMAYLNGDSDLEDEMFASLNKMELVGSNPHINIIVNLDDLHRWDGETRRYYVKHDTDLHAIQSKLVDNDTREENMGDPQTLIDFVCWATMKYPARHYCLIIAGHGNGWTGVIADHSSSYDSLSMHELKAALQTITNHMETKLDILCFNACSMGMIEVFYQTKDYIDIGIASEDLQRREFPYHLFLSQLRNTPDLSPTQFSKEIVNTSFNSDMVYDISAFNVEKIQEVATKVDILATKLEQKLPLYYYLMTSSIRRSLSFVNYFDLYDFIHEIKKHFFFDNTICTLAQQALDTIDTSILASRSVEYNNGKVCHGYSIYLEHREGYYVPQYENLGFARDTHWDEFIRSYLDVLSNRRQQTT